ncbi:MAG: MarR family winged helix-turn-helix transcriptional regulator [Microgenomates group bacterium]
MGKERQINQIIFDKIFNLYRQLKKNIQFDSRFFNLTMIQLHSLIFFKNNSSSQLSDLARSFSITLPTATSLTNKLVEMNLLERIPDKKDRRIVHFTLTKKGNELLRKAEKNRKRAICLMLDKLTKKEKIQFLKILNKIFS